MDFFHLSAKTISRKCQSSCAAAAYCAAEKIKDERTGITYDYTWKGGVIYSEIFTPAGSPTWAFNRSELWNSAELAEEKSTQRAKATTAREFIIALPYELDKDAQIASAREFALYIVNTYGVVVDFSIHEPSKEGDERNFHVHFILTDRRITDAGLAGKVRELNIANGGRANIAAIREQWAEIANRFLARAGVLERIDHRSYKSQGIDREPTIHLGIAATALERRDVATERGNHNRNVAEINAIRVKLETLGAELHAQELENMEMSKEADKIVAIEEADAATIIELIPSTHTTFTVQDVDAAVRRVSDPVQRERTASLTEQHRLDQQKVTETPKPLATKITNKEYIEIAKAKAKVDNELSHSRSLERDYPNLGRGRGR